MAWTVCRFKGGGGLGKKGGGVFERKGDTLMHTIFMFFFVCLFVFCFVFETPFKDFPFYLPILLIYFLV